MKIILDTNRYTDFCKGENRAVEVFRTAERIFVPFVVLGELRAGFSIGSRSQENERVLTRFLNSVRVEVLLADDQTTHHYARLFRQLRQQGTPIPTNDLWIAALVSQHDLLLFDRDKHFDHMPQLARLS
ncbi:MAG: type II toxin-antitoxin system VapC family toxin [Deltaproteobacteria bacterium]|nr:type II toxin-antitoxin system VapC family toxin [Deltaproteobacteria bacterium]